MMPIQLCSEFGDSDRLVDLELASLARAPVSESKMGSVENREKLIELLKSGMNQRQAANALGVSQGAVGSALRSLAQRKARPLLWLEDLKENPDDPLLRHAPISARCRSVLKNEEIAILSDLKKTLSTADWNRSYLNRVPNLGKKSFGELLLFVENFRSESSFFAVES